MRIPLLTLLVAFCLAALLTGCGESQPASTAHDASAPPPAKSPETPSTPAATPASPASAPVPDAQQATASDIATQLSKAAAAQADKVLSSVGTDLAQKVKALGQMSGVTDALKSRVDNSLTSLLEGKDASALTSLYQVAQDATLTPQQVQVLKEMSNLASAYVVQKDFSALQGAQGDVAIIVNSLRSGDLASAIPAVQKVANNANLTVPQREILASIADRYAPGLSKAAGSLQQGLQSLQGLGK